jgi:methylase of polypeptide subunit release factors
MKFVLIVEGDAANANSAIPECLDICTGYGLTAVDLIKQLDPESAC